MRFPFFIAFRYLFSRKSTNVINVISGISVLGVTVGTAALVILLSAFNGLESWVVRLYDAFDADLKVTHVSDKFFDTKAVNIDQLKKFGGIGSVMQVIEENGLVTFQDAQYICTIKGVGPEFIAISGVDSMMVDGTFALSRGSAPAALAGSGVAYHLSLNIYDVVNPLEIYIPKPDANFTSNPASAFRSGLIFPSGVFEIQPEVDTRYLIVPLPFAKDLFGRPEQLSSIEIQLKPGISADAVEAGIQDLVGSRFQVQNRFEQHELLYKIINSEKWAVYLVLTFILLIAVFNVTGSLTMLIVDKARDIRTLQSLGADWPVIRMIFFLEGLFISTLGLIAGIVIGILTVVAQEKFSMVMISEEDAYPVVMTVADISFIAFTVICIGALAAWFPAARILKKYRIRLIDN